MIVNAGLNLMRDLMADPLKEPPSHVAVGTGTTTEVAGDTTLESEVKRITLTATTKSGYGILEYVSELSSTEANGNSLSEMGVLNAAAAGDMLLRKTHAAFSKTSNFSVKYVVRHTITNV